MAIFNLMGLIEAASAERAADAAVLAALALANNANE
jgi:hypothetical protein